MRLKPGCALALIAVMMGVAASISAPASEVSVGLYADQAGTLSRLTVAPDQPFWLYLVLDRPVAQLPAAVGQPMSPLLYDLRLRCRFEIPANLWVINFDTSLGGLCDAFLQRIDPEIDARYYFNMLLWPTDTSCALDRCLMRVGLMALDDSPASIGLKASAESGAVDGLPTLWYTFCDREASYVVGALGLRPLPAGLDAPVFTVNARPVPNDASSWGAVKVLYR